MDRAVRCPPDRSDVHSGLKTSQGYVYILRSTKNKRYYIGSTDNVCRRLEEHNSGRSEYTSESGPFELMYSQEYESIGLARKIEYWIKRQKDKKLLERIVQERVIRKRF